MYLKKLEIQGFKSFAPKTTLEFSPGVTAIVGPNGSGKSNFTEAIRWVMGEQSMKTLRGKKSQDIIFAGSKSKPRMGMAQVSMHLDNTDHAMPIDYSEVVIARKLFRNGESEYYINKNKARLFDIKELLAKTGFGQKTYSVIGQGMIDAFLKAGPKERKELFEEAAGVKQYQIKRNSSLNKLERTKNNLTRVADLLNEIEPRLKSLKRQANKAQKKEEVEHELKKISESYFNHCWNKLAISFEESRVELKKFDTKEAEIISNVNKLRKELDNENLEYDLKRKKQKQDELNDLFEKKNRLGEQIVILSGKSQAMKDRDTSLSLGDKINLLEEEITKLTLEIKDFETEKQEFEKKLAERTKEQSNILAQIKTNQEKLSKLKSGILAPSLSFKEVEKDLDLLFKNESDLLEKINDCHHLTELEKLKNNIFDLHFEMEKILSKIKEAAKLESSNIQKQLSEIQHNLNKAFNLRDGIIAKINSIKVKIAVLETKEKSAIHQLNPKKDQITGLRSELKINSKKDKQIILDKLEREGRALNETLKNTSQNIIAIQKDLSDDIKLEQKRRAKFIDMEEQYRKEQDLLNQIRDESKGVEIKKAGVETGKKLLLEEMTDCFGKDGVSNLIGKFEKQPEKIDNEETLKIKMDRLKKQKMAIGEIDSDVIAEFEQVDKRYNFLTSQKNDLEGAIRSLKSIIVKLDATINERFNLSFKKINEQFQKYFKILFAGGRAELSKYKPKMEVLNEERDQETKLSQELYIDIKATPPGKRLRDLTMLSGGERALTSIALILAIIFNNPSPFIVLDEVDAALDESNTSRYAKIIEDAAKKSQFIVVTHNRETMKCADTLYGVTMGHDGISKLLSIKLEKREKTDIKNKVLGLSRPVNKQVGAI